ncbi:MAG: T9SS type A sorting domain-containing protein [Ignavibacteriae bacterium]|nr:T9SS type A sorting domain-containing protein [Ignavibacteriota bacterium]
MKRLALMLFLSAVAISTATAQLTITSTVPANDATSVAAATTISITFSAAIDSSILAYPDRGVFTNVDTIQVIGLSPDKRTISYSAHLTPGRAHYIVYYYVKAASGAALTAPHIFYFTTAASFPAPSVSGTVQAGSSGVDPANCLVVLTDGPISGGGKPNLMLGGVSTTGGAFTIPHVANGTYYPVAVKDIDQDGEINPESSGDPFVQGGAFTVADANVTGVLLELARIQPLSFRTACDSATAAAATLPADRSLRRLSCYDPDSLGLSGDWNFEYHIPSRPSGARLRVGPMGCEIDSLDMWTRQSIAQARPLSDLASAAEASTFLTNCENAGGNAFRTQPMGDTIEFSRHLNLGDLRWNEFSYMITDTSKNYWAASYWWGHSNDSMWIQKKVMRFLGDFQTGAILKTTEVRPSDEATVPEQATLTQNYPNPFNPSTMVAFSIPSTQEVTLTVYNLLGERVAVLADGIFARGSYDVQINGAGWPSGVYFCILQTSNAPMVRKMVLMK